MSIWLKFQDVPTSGSGDSGTDYNFYIAFINYEPN